MLGPNLIDVLCHFFNRFRVHAADNSAECLAETSLMTVTVVIES